MSTKENGAANKNNINKKNGVEPVAAAVNGVEPVAAAATNGVNDVNGAAEEVVPNHQNGGRHKKRRTKHRKTKSRKHRATKSRKHRR